MPYYSRPEEVLEAIANLFKANREKLGFTYVATQDENLIPEYPALQISMGAMLREDHGTQRFLLTFEAAIWVYHANYEATHAERNIEDMKLATAVVHFLHERKHRALEDQGDPKLIPGSGRITQEIPGVILSVNNRIVTTRLIWQGQSQVNYEDS